MLFICKILTHNVLSVSQTEQLLHDRRDDGPVPAADEQNTTSSKNTST